MNTSNKKKNDNVTKSTARAISIETTSSECSTPTFEQELSIDWKEEILALSEERFSDVESVANKISHSVVNKLFPNLDEIKRDETCKFVADLILNNEDLKDMLSDRFNLKQPSS